MMDDELTTFALFATGLSVVGIGLGSYLSYRTWHKMVEAPSNDRTWRFVASVFVLITFVTLLVTALGALLHTTGTSTAASERFLYHSSIILRGGLIGLTVALVYGWRSTHLNGGT